MSCPLRMLRGRPTAPLPTQYAPYSFNYLQKDRRRVKTTTRRGSPTSSGQPKTSSTYNVARVREYLASHKDVLEDFILKDVSKETLERILLKKAQSNNSALLSDAYKQLAKLMLEDQTECQAALQTVDDIVTKTINASGTALFILDSKGKTLYAQNFTTVKEEEEQPVTLDHLETTHFQEYLGQLWQQLSVAHCQTSAAGISIDKGVVGYTAKTGMLQNVTNVKTSRYFCAEVDGMSGHATKTLLCVPLITQGRTLGVLEAVDKKDGVFTEMDEKYLQSFAEFFALLIDKCRMKEEFSTIESQLKVAQGILNCHRPCSDDHFQQVKAITLSIDEEKLVQSASIDTAALSHDKKVKLVLTMFTDLVDVSSFQFDLDQCLKFALTVAKSYRNVEYHNWDHAFSVAHCMYWLLKGSPERFSDIEIIALFWGCVCHDLGHCGHSNAFLVKTGSPLAKLYSSSILESHHFTETLVTLGLEGHDIFSCLSSEQYKEVLTIMRRAILATDLGGHFFSNKEKLSKIVNSGDFSWGVHQHRELVIYLMMTASDLCSSYKPWEKHRTGTMILFEEFYKQGDEEKALGLTPMEMMDRNFRDTIPSSQVGFLKFITCACCEVLLTPLPQVEKLLHSARNNMEMWERLSKEKTE